MSDDRLRQAERAAAGGAPEDRARLITERVRRGELDLVDVRLAAHAGDPAARLVAGHPGCGVCEERGSLAGELLGRPGERVACHLYPRFEDWCAPFRASGEVGRRAVVAALSQALTTQGEGDDLRAALARWRDCPCDAHDREARALALAHGGIVGELAQRAVLEGASALEDVALRLSSEVAVREAIQQELVPRLLLEETPSAPAADAVARVASAEELVLAAWSTWLGERLLALAERQLDVTLVRRVMAVVVTDDAEDAARRLQDEARYTGHEVRVIGGVGALLRTSTDAVVAVARDEDIVSVELTRGVTWPARPGARRLSAWVRETARDRRTLPIDHARAWLTR